MPSHSTARADAFGTLRFAARLIILVTALLVASFLHLLWRLVRMRSPWPRLFLAFVADACGMDVRTRGTPVRHDVFYVANHVSWLDIPALAALTGTAFVAQAPMAEWPLIGWLAKINNSVFVSRTDLLSVDDQVAALRAALDERQPITIFPEGTTTDNRSLLPFKRSLFEVMAPPPRPMVVQPVLLDFGAEGPGIAWIGEESFGDNARRVLSRAGRFAITVDFLEPFDPSGFSDRKAIAAEARARIAAALSASLGGAAIV